MKELLVSFLLMPWYLVWFLSASSVFFLVLIFLDTIRKETFGDGALSQVKQVYCIIISPLAVLSVFALFTGINFWIVLLSMAIAWIGSLIALSSLKNVPTSYHADVSLFIIFWFVVLIDALTKSFLLGNIFSTIAALLLLLRLIFILKAKIFDMRIFLSCLFVPFLAVAIIWPPNPFTPIMGIFNMIMIFYLQMEND